MPKAPCFLNLWQIVSYNICAFYASLRIPVKEENVHLTVEFQRGIRAILRLSGRTHGMEVQVAGDGMTAHEAIRQRLKHF